MSETLSGAFDAPLVETVNGKQVTLPLFTMDDLALLGREIQNDKKVKAMAGVALNNTAEKQRISNFYDEQDSDVDALSRYVWTLAGTRNVLMRSLVKGGLDKVTALQTVLAIARERGWQNTSALAAEVSALFSPRSDRQEKSDPNAVKGESETGTSTDSSSPPSIEATLAI